MLTHHAPHPAALHRNQSQVWFKDAKAATLDDIPRAFFETLRAALEPAAFDLERMRAVITQHRRRTLERLERAPSDSVMRQVIEHFLYAPRGSADGAGDAAEVAALAEGLDALPKLEAAEKLSAAEWIALGKTFMFDRPCAAVVGRPNAALAKEIAEGVKTRQEAKRAELGEEGLAQMAATLAAAVEKNETPIPSEYLQAVRPSVAHTVHTLQLHVRTLLTLACALCVWCRCQSPRTVPCVPSRCSRSLAPRPSPSSPTRARVCRRRSRPPSSRR